MALKVKQYIPPSGGEIDYNWEPIVAEVSVLWVITEPSFAVIIEPFVAVVGTEGR